MQVRLARRIERNAEISGRMGSADHEIETGEFHHRSVRPKLGRKAGRPVQRRRKLRQQTGGCTKAFCKGQGLGALDLESSRGTLFAYEPTAPGPLLVSTEELIEKLRDLDGVRSQYAEAYATFRATYCDLDDGHAAERLVDRVFDH